MKLLVKLIILFAFASLIGYIFVVSDGHITIYMGVYRYDLSLLLFVFFLIVGYILFTILIKIIFKIIAIPRLVKNQLQKRIKFKITKMLFTAMNAYMDGDYKKATKLALTMFKYDLSLDQRILVVKIGYLSSQLANLDVEYAKIKQQIADYKLNLNQFIDFSDIQIKVLSKK